MIITPQEKLDLYQQQGRWDGRRLHDLLYKTAAKKPEEIALVDPADKVHLTGGEPQHLTYRQLTRQIDRLATVLLQQGIGKDDILLVQMPNIVELVLVYMAASRLGVIVSPVAVQYQEHELSDIIRILEPSAVIGVAELKGAAFLDHLQAAIDRVTTLPKAPQLLLWGEAEGCVNLSNALRKDVDQSTLKHYCENTHISANDILTICWTSGTEGSPKGIPRSHNQWLAVGRATYEGNRIEDGEALLNPFPFINMASIGGLFLSWLYSGGKLVLHHPLDLPVFLLQIVEEQISYTLAPPALLNNLLKNDQLLASCNFSGIRAIGSGSAPLDEWMVAGFKERFDIEVVNHFGSNEGVSLLCGPNETDSPAKRARLFPRHSTIMQARLVNPENGELIEEPGHQGELQIQGPGVFDGYYKDPEKTARSFTIDGYFRTGDLFEIDSDTPDFYRFIGRCKDVIIRGGMNIAPAELDNLICAHQDVAQAAVAGYPCEVMGERVAAFVVSRSGRALQLEDIVSYLRDQKLAPFKLPEKLVMVEAIPRNPLGKVLRHQLEKLI
ncbi:class I adenylate-forming enzyme family protein [Microbulbifer sp. SSSA002]|uniref:class I adenylate-forming enzyme family protein n=1 Tax=unclassified Microbulbifer TaxID=2619833 RepID=UPI00403A3EF8